ncbi:acyl-CoA thioester hydrolase/BAAT C-terminal domain-containing protein [Streptomyces albiaxialis]|uniref:Acyl-CoA thioester hydrolase/BAAT C-terminal domain-containing protein n=2 Tax=Streptomyces albiaxialis TaxID=329523 RepID=A0ABP5HLW1_9ACTN
MNGGVRAVVAAGLVVALGAGCAGGEGGQDGQDGNAGKAALTLGRGNGTALADQPLDIGAERLPAGAEVTLTASAKDRYGKTWRSRTRASADKDGRLALGGKTSSELLSGMLPDTHPKLNSGKTFSYHPGPPGEQRAYSVRLNLTAAKSGKRLASRTLTREWLTGGATHRELTADGDKLAGDLYNPPKGEPRKAPVLVFGGSEGGNAGTYTAALLASHGHPALSLCYFRCGKGSGRPDAIDMIDLDYFTRAARLLGKQPSADPGKLTVMGNSRGSEAAQLLGQRRPSVVRNVVAYAPSSKAIGPYPSGQAAWADHGRALPTGPLPLDRVRGTVLAVGGGNDKMWGSAASARDMAAHGARKLVYPDAGHHVNWFPYGQPGQEGGADGAVARTSAADQRARADSWPRILKLLES